MPESAVLWDNDFEVQEGMDADPESNTVKELLVIPENYFTEVPLDVTRLNLYIDALKGLNPCGREAGTGETTTAASCFDSLSVASTLSTYCNTRMLT